MTQSEEYVSLHCRNTFLTMWGFANPRRFDNGKELCDYLVIVHNAAIVISVKEIDVIPSGNEEIDIERWEARALEKSYRQLYGAERALQNGVAIYSCDTREPIDFDANALKAIFKIGVVIGRGDKFHLKQGNLIPGKGFVHFFDESSFPIVIGELDTVIDFIEYLEMKEEYLGKHRLVISAEENLLAIYLHCGRRFPEEVDTLVVHDNLWQEFSSSDSYIRRKKAEEESYLWDTIIEEVALQFLGGELLGEMNRNNTESILRYMNLERRFYRRMLAHEFLEVVGWFGDTSINARMSKSKSGVVYVFLVEDLDESRRTERQRKLELRCWAARNVMVDSQTVIGIATNRYRKGTGHSYDLCLLEVPSLPEETRSKILEMQKALGYFTSPKETQKHYDEYPESDNP